MIQINILGVQLSNAHFSLECSIHGHNINITILYSVLGSIACSSTCIEEDIFMYFFFIRSTNKGDWKPSHILRTATLNNLICAPTAKLVGDFVNLIVRYFEHPLITTFRKLCCSFPTSLSRFLPHTVK